ncbi:hypothetical protein J0683_24855, partial [Vibrio parahaemolyticus]|uniref:hypothetical protein n=1 Tax=Vibrio parahaemolyticus TaxID=670 RepID=UPI001A8E7B4A|nr:hypothetical protein [Vibrio parahaemolyticus]
PQALEKFGKKLQGKMEVTQEAPTPKQHEDFEKNTDFDQTTLVPCTLSQDELLPFSLEISREALLYIDFHSHLSQMEVIGWLAGTW